MPSFSYFKFKKIIMKLYNKWMEAFEKRDFDEVMQYYHPDYTFVRHQTNTEMKLSEWAPMMKSMLESDQLKMVSAKCCYDNDEVLVVHNIMSFPNGSKEAVLACHTKKMEKL